VPAVWEEELTNVLLFFTFRHAEDGNREEARGEPPPALRTHVLAP
jgi:hypothetical protein